MHTIACAITLVITLQLAHELTTAVYASVSNIAFTDTH